MYVIIFETVEQRYDTLCLHANHKIVALFLSATFDHSYP